MAPKHTFLRTLLWIFVVEVIAFGVLTFGLYCGGFR
jgi:hypothetical protein